MSRGRTLMAMNEAVAVSIAVSGTRPSLATDGVDIRSWRTNGIFAPPLAGLFLNSDEAQVIDSPTGGTSAVELWAYRPNFGWNRIGYLNDALPIAIAGNGQGYAQEVNILGIFERLAVAGLKTTGTHATTAKFAPIDQWTGP